MTWMIGSYGLGKRSSFTGFLLIPVWDAIAFLLWLTSFTRSTIRWRDVEYRIENGQLVPTSPEQSSAP